ncbi:MAG: hypothetical protein EBX47_11625 [Synechococcaceae bacterium WB8_1B_057]|nr:hypothetical protein [Synechococcaceae bacterium WB6_1A_059]NDG80046.1 hypothetical protein [Synechococcaceae bacterium WB8_1B_057]
MEEVRLKELEFSRYEEIKAWCQEQYGHGAWWRKQLESPKSKFSYFVGAVTPEEEWKRDGKGSAIFAFRDEREATMFRLKWAC